MARDSARISVSLSTKERLLDAAEALFARNGIQGASLREITSHAGTNIASVNYHYGSKEGLIQAVFERRVTPLNEERMRLLDIIEGHFAPEKPSLDAVLFAIMAPAMRCISNSPDFARLAGRLQSDPDEEVRARVFLSQFRELAVRCMPMLAATVPHLSEEELFWRMHFIVGMMMYTWTNFRDVDTFSNNTIPHPLVKDLTKRLVLAARETLQAPSAKDANFDFKGIDRVYMLPEASLPEILGETIANA